MNQLLYYIWASLSTNNKNNYSIQSIAVHNVDCNFLHRACVVKMCILFTSSQLLMDVRYNFQVCPCAAPVWPFHLASSFHLMSLRLQELICLNVIQVDIRAYDMQNVTMWKVSHSILGLHVPGLAERRPSVIYRDKIYVRPSGSATREFQVAKLLDL